MRNKREKMLVIFEIELFVAAAEVQSVRTGGVCGILELKKPGNVIYKILNHHLDSSIMTHNF
jgi:hypothetical protein